VREKPFIATLTDPTRSFIQGTANNEFYRLDRDNPQRVTANVAAALRETLYQVEITGDEPATAKIAESKSEKGAKDGNTGTDDNGSTSESGEETGSEEGTGSEETADESGTGEQA
jgi:hypothetical protein